MSKSGNRRSSIDAILCTRDTKFHAQNRATYGCRERIKMNVESRLMVHYVMHTEVRALVWELVGTVLGVLMSCSFAPYDLLKVTNSRLNFVLFKFK